MTSIRFNLDAGGVAGTDRRDFRNGVRIFPTVKDLMESASAHIAAIANHAIAVRGTFGMVITGGQSVCALYGRLRFIDTNWQAWRIFWSDERCCPTNHAERNSRQAEETWLGHVPIPRHRVFQIPAELGPNLAAEIYSRTLAQEAPFDLVLLTLGEDGHVASIFPGMESKAETRLAVPVCDAPKSPARRVSMSLESLSNTRHSMLLSVGHRKEAAMLAHLAGIAQPSTTLGQLTGVELWTESQHAELARIGSDV